MNFTFVSPNLTKLSLMPSTLHLKHHGISDLCNVYLKSASKSPQYIEISVPLFVQLTEFPADLKFTDRFDVDFKVSDTTNSFTCFVIRRLVG